MQSHFVIVAIMLVLSFSRLAAGETAKRDLPYREYLEQAGEKLDCWFTVEDGGPDGELPPLTRGRTIANASVKSIKDLITHLAAELPDIDVFVDESDKSLIRLVAKRLAKEKDYVMNSKATLKYQGAVGELPDAIGKAVGVKLRSPASGTMSDISTDMITQVSVEVVQQKVRDILTSAVTKKGYHRLIWYSRVLTFEGHRTTWVQFFGRTKKD